MSFEYSIAHRLFGHREEGQKLSRPAVRIAMWGVAVGLAVMILSVCIILGFKGEIRNKIIGFGGHIEVINYNSLYSSEAQAIVVDSALLNKLSGFDGVTHAQRFATKAGLLKTEELFKGVILHGMAEEYDTTFLCSHLLEGRLPIFSSSEISNEVAVSALIAKELHLKVGDKVFAYFFSEQVKARRFNIVGIYETHLSEFDNLLIFTDLKGVQRLNDWRDDQCAGVQLSISDFNQLEMRTDSVRKVMNRTTDADGNTYSTHAVTELYPGLFSWLDVLDTNVYVILILMICLSIFTMSSGLLIIILERTYFIAIMKSLGASNSQIRSVFMHLAAFLVGQGLLWGNILGIGLAFLQKSLGIVHLDPATYYVDSVPIEFSWWLILLMNVGTLVITLSVLLIPSHLVSRIHPVQVMRFE